MHPSSKSSSKRLSVAVVIVSKQGNYVAPITPANHRCCEDNKSAPTNPRVQQSLAADHTWSLGSPAHPDRPVQICRDRRIHVIPTNGRFNQAPASQNCGDAKKWRGSLQNHGDVHGKKNRTPKKSRRTKSRNKHYKLNLFNLPAC